MAGPRFTSRRIGISRTSSRRKADKAAVPFSALPVPLRIGNLKPDWRVPAAADAADWSDMQLPGAWETRGLPDFDGVVWFTRTFESKGTDATTLSIGPVRNNAEVWVNGLSLAFVPAAPGAGPGGGRGGGGRFAIPDGTLRPGANTIAVRIQNGRGNRRSDVRRRASARQPRLSVRRLEMPSSARRTRGRCRQARRARRARCVHGRGRYRGGRRIARRSRRRRRTSSSASRL